MRRALGANATVIGSGGGSLPSSSALSSSAPDYDRLGAAYASNFAHANQNPHHPITRSASTLQGSGPSSDNIGPRSRSALGLSTRPHASRSVAGPHDHKYQQHQQHQHPHHPPRDPHSRSGHSYSDLSDAATPRSTATTAMISPSSSSPSKSALSVRADDMLVASAVELSPERRQMLVDFVDRSVDDAYNLCHGFGSVRWLPSKTREGVSIYRAKGGELSDDPRLDASVRGKCNVSASFDEMMDTMVTETTSDFVAHESSVNPAEFLDGQVLCSLVPRTRTDRFVCVKWHCIKSLAPSVAKHRDYVYVEVVDHFTDRDGRKVGFRLSKSVELEELEAFDHSEIFVRGKTLTLHTFSQVSPGNIELYTMMINDLGERLPAWLVHKIVDTAAMRSACLRDSINQKRMDLMVLARPKEMVPLHKRVCCVVCTRSFSLVRKKYNCVACGDVICNQCSVHQFVAPPSGTISDFVGKKKARICVQCSSNAKRRELPRRASSARASMLQQQQQQHEADAARLSEMEHRRVSGSTIGSSKLQKQQSAYAQNLNRMMRSASSVEASSSSSVHEEQGRVHPSDPTGNNNRSTIPHMFQFRPAKNNSSVLSAGRSSIRSSGMSTARSSSSPDDDTLLHAAAAAEAGNDQSEELSDDDDDDDQEYMIPGDAELEANGMAAAAAAAAVAGGDMDFDNLLDATALDATNGVTSSMDLGVGKYRASYTNAGTLSTDVSEDELTDADDDDTLTTPSTGSSGSGGSTALSPPPTSTPLGDTEDDDGLIIQEVSPQNSFRQSVASRRSVTSNGPTPRHSIVSMTSTEDEVMIVKPMVVKHVRKRPAPGTSTRASKSEIDIAEVQPAQPNAPPELPPPRVNPLVESIVTQSRRATITEEPTFDNNSDAEYNETIQLADLQVHLDRMTMISESLKNLHQPTESPTKKMRPSIVTAAELEAQYAKISNIEMRAQEEAALAAGFAQAIMDEAQANAAAVSEHMVHQAEEVEMSDDDYGEDDEIELMDLSLGSDVHLTREDGSFSGFLADSSFMDMASASPEGTATVPGWVAVHSKTTGKLYFYNESVGTTSWTVPTPDTSRRSGSYMVL